MTKDIRKKQAVLTKELVASVLKDSVVAEAYHDIKEIKVQGATNVAIHSIKTTLSWLDNNADKYPLNVLLQLTILVLYYLATARPNEPLATNALRFLIFKLRESNVGEGSQYVEFIKQTLWEYLAMIDFSKKEILKVGTPVVADTQIIFTHCHSSTAERLIVHANRYKPKTVIATETRPLYQGRITVRHLVKHGIKTIMIVDSAATYFISDESYLDVDAILIGADQIIKSGETINKVGSFAISLAAHYYKKPLYVVTPSLKLDPEATVQTKIELRPAHEVWRSAPKGLQIINPAFELIPAEFITGFITELGVLKPHELAAAVFKSYPWLRQRLPRVGFSDINEV